MSNLRIERRRHQGGERLTVNRVADGETVAWYDLKSGEVKLLSVADGQAALNALAPYVEKSTPPGAPAASPAATPSAAPTAPTPPGADLAANPPGTALRRLIESHAPSHLKRTLRRWTGADSNDLRDWETALRGERITGASLNKLRRSGWYILHSIPLPGGADIDHLAIGPSGVFTVTTKHLPHANVWVGDHAVKVNSQKTDYILSSLAEAKRVSQVLGEACRFDVEVRAVLAFVGEAERTDETAIPSVLPVDGARVHQRLSGLAPNLPPDKAAIIFRAARNPRTWLAV